MARGQELLAKIGVSTHSRPKAAVGVPVVKLHDVRCFNTQPPEGGCAQTAPRAIRGKVSTHSRPKAAVSENFASNSTVVSTHSRPKAAGHRVAKTTGRLRFQHTAARRRLACNPKTSTSSSRFQHTAARRRLTGDSGGKTGKPVSTHSRPKAAGAKFTD